jgi:5-(carboxyamino)imidazole ribonucleotide mutase
MYRRGIRVVIAGAGGSAHLAGMTTAFEPMLTVKGVPCPSASNQLNDWAAVFSMAFMPKGVGNATYSIGAAGAVNAALDAAKFVAEYDPNLRRRLRRYYDNQTAAVAFKPSREKLKEQKK